MAALQLVKKYMSFRGEYGLPHQSAHWLAICQGYFLQWSKYANKFVNNAFKCSQSGKQLPLHLLQCQKRLWQVICPL